MMGSTGENTSQARFVRVKSPNFNAVSTSPLLQSVSPAVRAELNDFCLDDHQGDPSSPLFMSPVGGMRARHVAAFAFAMTCSGPFGLEDCIKNMGAVMTLLGFVSVSFVYVLPQILMTCELSMTLPLSNGGVASWVSRAFGSNAGACVGLNMLVYQVVDLATYPTLVIGYSQSAGYDIPEWTQYAIPFLVVVLGFCINVLNIEIASEIYSWLLFFILLPCLIGVLCAIPYFDVSWALATGEEPATVNPGKANMNVFVSTMFWLNTGWDSMGNLASEVSSPNDMVGGLFLAAIVALCLYIVCTLAALGAGPGSWKNGYLAEAFGHFWKPLAPWICACAGLGNLLLYTSELTTVAHLVQSMGDPEGEIQLLPAFFAKRLNSGAPIVALAIVSICESLLCCLSFDYLVQLSTLLHVVAFWMALAAFLRLKFWHPDITRLFVIPGGKYGGWAIFLVKAPVLLFVLGSACSDWTVVLGAIGGNIVFLACLGMWSCCLKKTPIPSDMDSSSLQ